MLFLSYRNSKKRCCHNIIAVSSFIMLRIIIEYFPAFTETLKSDLTELSL